MQALDDDSHADEQAFCHFLADNKNTLQKPFDKYFDNENLQ